MSYLLQKNIISLSVSMHSKTKATNLNSMDHACLQHLNYLSSEEIQFFMQKGYLHLKDIIPRSECHRYDQDVVKPALKKLANLYEDDDSTWFLEHNNKLKPFVTQNNDSNNNDKGIPIGMMVFDSQNKEHCCNPISVEEDDNWGAIFNNEKIIGILDELHNFINSNQQRSDLDIQSQRRWKFLHSGVGWIHVRLPITQNNDKFSNSIQMNVKQNTPNTSEEDQSFYIPRGEKTWHVDGGHFTPHKVSSPDQSVIILPCLRDINSNCGNTLLLPGSHIQIAQKLYENRENGVDKFELNDYCEELASNWPSKDIVEVAPCSAGDILLLHPFIAHSAGRNRRKVIRKMKSDIDNFRLTFNIGTKWNEDTVLSILDAGDLNMENCKNKPMSILEWSVVSSIL